MTKSTVRNSVLLVVVFVFSIAGLFYPEAITSGKLIGAALIVIALRIWLEFLLGLPLNFLFAGTFPCNDSYRMARIVALSFSFVFFVAGIIFSWKF